MKVWGGWGEGRNHGARLAMARRSLFKLKFNEVNCRLVLEGGRGWGASSVWPGRSKLAALPFLTLAQLHVQAGLQFSSYLHDPPWTPVSKSHRG